MLTIYRFPTLYRLAMRVGYGADAEARYPLIADLVADQTGRPSHILELCCGDLALYRHLLRRGLARSYLGLEQSPAMLRLARRRGVDVRAFDVRAAGELPTADTVIMQASLYQFHDIADTLLPRLWAAARRLLVIAEPEETPGGRPQARKRSEEHTSELQSPCNLVCRLLLEKKKKK